MKIPLLFIACVSSAAVSAGNPKCRTVHFEYTENGENPYDRIIDRACEDTDNTHCVLVELPNNDIVTTCSNKEFGYCRASNLDQGK